MFTDNWGDKMEGYYEIKAYIIIENIILDYNKNQIKKMTYDDIAEYIIEYFKSVLLDDITKYTQDKLLDIVTEKWGDNKC